MILIRILCIAIILYFIIFLYRDLYIYKKVIKICKEKQKYLKIMLPIIIDKLNEYNITYFISAGTLLGYERHNKKFIPWDDDIDLIILYTEDLDEKIKLIKKDIEKYFYIDNIFFGYKIICKDSKTFIDLFIYHEEKNKIESKSMQCMLLWPNDYFIKDETFPLIKDIFEDIEVFLPNNHKLYLKRQYGNYKKLDLSHNHYCNIFENAIICIKNFTKKNF